VVKLYRELVAQERRSWLSAQDVDQRVAKKMLEQKTKPEHVRQAIAEASLEARCSPDPSAYVDALIEVAERELQPKKSRGPDIDI
jgi:hypothetical protein